ncbi:MAG: NCS2 family permease [Acidobacteriota bacterium]
MFRFHARGSSLAIELRAGLATFMVMAYIIFVNPSILGSVTDRAGESLSFPAVLTVSCLTAGTLSILMGILSNYPFAMAPGMGLNAVVAYQLVGQLELTWPEAMAVVFLEGAIITVLVLTRLREAIMEAIPAALKQAIAVGIGLFIALIGLVNGGLVSRGRGTVLTLGPVQSLPFAVFILGLILTAALLARRVRGALLWGILFSTFLAVGVNHTLGEGRAFGNAALIPEQFVGFPEGLWGPHAVLGRLDFGFLFRLGVASSLLVTFSLMLSDFFDTMGTVMGLSSEAGLLNQEGKLPAIRRVLLVDSLGAALGGLANSSSNTTFIESAAGIAEGGRTGLTAVVVGLLFYLGMFLNPLAAMIPKEATAPALVLVGFLMMSGVREISWNRLDEALPAFMTMLVMPFTYSISNGIGAGLITYAALKVLAGAFRDVSPLLIVASLAFLVYFLAPA